MPVELMKYKRWPKIVFMCMLLTFSCLLTYYFYSHLKMETIFSHFFYIPIFIGAYWWKRKGIIIPIFLGLFLIICHELTIDDVVTKHHYFRALMFVVFSAMAIFLSERISKRESELENALNELRRVESEKSRFLNIVVHDLKSPVVAIESLVNSILSVHGDEFDPKIKKLLERIPVRTEDLVRFIRKLLEFSHIRKQKQIEIPRKVLDILAIVNSTVEIYLSMINEKNITLNVQSDKNILPILGSKEHIDSMVGNLVSNAIRYTLDNGSVTISVGTENNDVILTVADTGIGIPEESLPQIFTDFYRASNAMKTSAMGTGIGMSIIKSIVEDHGGTISVKSREGEGATFTVRLPAALVGSEPVDEVYS